VPSTAIGDGGWYGSPPSIPVKFAVHGPGRVTWCTYQNEIWQQRAYDTDKLACQISTDRWIGMGLEPDIYNMERVAILHAGFAATRQCLLWPPYV